MSPAIAVAFFCGRVRHIGKFGPLSATSVIEADTCLEAASHRLRISACTKCRVEYVANQANLIFAACALTADQVMAGLKKFLPTAESLMQSSVEVGECTTLSQMALAWLLKDDRVTSVIVGASRVQQLEDDFKALENISFTPEELAAI